MLRRLHEKVLEAHRQSNIEMLVEDTAPEGVVLSRGEVLHVGADGTREGLAPYLARTRFAEYRDLIEPIVTVSEDGTLGWVVVQVYARGTQTTADGAPEPLEFTCAWIELYRRDRDRWLRVGNVSNFKEESPRRQ
jgi:hypothetical protein